MAKTTVADWDKAKILFEAGKSLSAINLATGIDKSLISKRAKKDDWVKGKTQQIILDGIRHELEKSTLDVGALSFVEKEITEHTKHIQFFTNAAIQNVSEAMEMKCEDQNDHKSRADTILKGKEAVLGKEAGNVINNTNAQQINYSQLLKEIAACLPD
jgi:hypothetical protein